MSQLVRRGVSWPGDNTARCPWRSQPSTGQCILWLSFNLVLWLFIFYFLLFSIFYLKIPQCTFTKDHANLLLFSIAYHQISCFLWNFLSRSLKVQLFYDSNHVKLTKTYFLCKFERTFWRKTLRQIEEDRKNRRKMERNKVEKVMLNWMLFSTSMLD